MKQINTQGWVAYRVTSFEVVQYTVQYYQLAKERRYTLLKVYLGTQHVPMSRNTDDS